MKKYIYSGKIHEKQDSRNSLNTLEINIMSEEEIDRYVLSEASKRRLQLHKGFLDNMLTDQSACYPVTQNVVCTLNLGVKIPLHKYVAAIGAVSHKQKKFSAVTTRVSTKPTAQVFGSGKCVMVGSPSVTHVLLMSHLLRFILRNMGVPAVFKRLLPRNKVCSGYVGHPIDIHNFEKEDSIGTVDHSKSFPGIVYFVTPPGSTTRTNFLLFKSGNIIAMGIFKTGSGDAEAHRAFKHVLPVLRRNKLEGSVTNKTIRQGLGRLTKKLQSEIQDIEAQIRMKKDVRPSLESLVTGALIGSSSSTSTSKKQRTF